MNKQRINHMEYMLGMEVLKSDVMDQVISRMEAYDYNQYTATDVQKALSHDSRTVEDFAALLSPAAAPF